MKIWMETGGDTGGAEIYCSDPDVEIARIDWDDWNDRDFGNYTPDDVFNWLENWGGVMPTRTRKLLLETLMPDDQVWKG